MNAARGKTKKLIRNVDENMKTSWTSS